MKQRIGIVGTGHVGGEVANEVLRGGAGDCVLVDALADVAHAKALDLSQTAPLRHSSSSASDSGDFEALRGCSLVVLAAGVARSPGMSRDDLLEVNCSIVKQTIPRIMHVAPDVPIIVVTNPLDCMTYAAWRLSAKDPSSVVGMAGVLDSSRFCAFLAAEMQVSCEDVHAMVLGSHGDLMVPLSRFASVSGIPVADLLDAAAMERVLARTRNAGNELVSLLKTGSAYYAAGTSTAVMVDSVIHDKRRVLCCSAQCRGEYGIRGVFVGVPVVLGAGGVHRVVELRLNDTELQALHRSAGHLQDLQSRVDTLLTR